MKLPIAHFLLALCLPFLPVYLSAQSVVINEVQVRPPTDGLSAQYQSMFNCPNPTFGAEWVELYNPDPCNAINLTGYILGARTIATNYGAVMLPGGASIPPLGFIVLGGPNAPNVDINLTSLCATSNICTDGDSRWYMENGDGWVALYNPAGTPVDAVYWTFSSGESSKLTTDGDYASAPCIPSGSAAPALSPASAMGGLIGYAGAGPSMNQTVYRTSDGGGTWANNGSPTPKACNAVCSALTCTPLAADPFVLNGVVMKNQLYVYWFCGDQEDCETYELETSSDLVHFETVLRLEALHQPHSLYEAQLPRGSSSPSWFRLAGLDLNGNRIHESNLLHLDAGFSPTAEVQAGPNPCQGEFHLYFKPQPEEKTVLQLFNFQGQVLSEKINAFSEASAAEMLDLSQYPAGIYFWKINSPFSRVSGRILLQGTK